MSDPEGTLAACVRAALPAGAPVLLAVSGGSDSVAMLAAARSQPELAGRIEVVHVQHGLRAAAATDCAHVIRLCAALELPVRVMDAAPTAADGGRSETAARRRRLAALGRAARERGVGWVLLAHHADDEHETLLLRLLRGHRGDRALAGIPTLRTLDTQTPGVRLLRPFLFGQRPGRDALAGARRAAGLAHVEDESNRDVRVPRNAVRAFLADGDPELGPRLEAVRRASRSRLQHNLRGATQALLDGLRAEGLGARVGREALPVGADDSERLAETLRLLGACLQLPRRLDVRATLLQQLRLRLASGGGRLSLPATPRPLELLVSRQHVALPHDALADPEPVAAVLSAVANSPQFL